MAAPVAALAHLETAKCRQRLRIRVHVLFTAHRFWPNVGGTELAILALARELLGMGHEVTVVTSDEPGRPAEEDHEGIHIRRFAMRRLGKFRLPPREYVDFVVHGPWDVIHVHGQRVWSSDYLFRHLAKSKAAKVFTAHGFHQWHMHRRDLVELWYYRLHLKWMLKPFDKVVALTTSEVEELVDFGVERERVVVIPDGVTLDEFDARPEPGFREKHGITAKHMLLYVGGHYDNKRVPFLVEAVSKMESDAELVVIGRDAHGLEAQAREVAQRTGARVKFLGLVERADVVRAFFESDLFLLGSKFEGYAIVLLEAMAAGVPFVSTPAGAAPDLARMGAGRVADSAEAMAREADALLADTLLRKQMGETGARLARGQTWAAIAREHAALYESLV